MAEVLGKQSPFSFGSRSVITLDPGVFSELAMCWDSAAIKRPKPPPQILWEHGIKGTSRTQVAGSTGTAKPAKG